MGYGLNNPFTTYDVENPRERATNLMAGAGHTAGGLQKAQQKPKKTAGGAVASAASGAAMGSVVPVYGTAIGAVAGLAMYYLS